MVECRVSGKIIYWSVSDRKREMATGLAPAARGYMFQDVVGGAAILSVLFEEADAVAIEDAFESGDKFDDLVLELDDERVCLQVRNRPDKRLTSGDLENASGDFNVDDFLDSARCRLAASEGSRFVVLTSFQEVPGPDVDLVADGAISFFGDLDFPARTLADGAGVVSNGTEIEYILGVPGIGTADDDELAETVRDTDLVSTIVRHVTPIFDELEHPEINDPSSLVMDAVDLARWARIHSSIGELRRQDIVRRLEYIPTPKLEQEFPVRNEFIEPQWMEEVESAGDAGDRVLVEGGPGSGKSTGIELLHREWSEANKRTLRFFLYVPDDAERIEKKRNDPRWFRHQLAAQLYRTFPEAFADETAAPVWTGTDDLQEYIDAVVRWADDQGQQPLIVIDGLDHALRSFGDTTHGGGIAGTVLEELAALEFPEPLTLLMVSRPLSSEKHDALNVDTSIRIPDWDDDEISKYLEENGVEPTEDLVDRMASVAGGLPVILSHLLRKAESFEGDLQDGLQSALDEASSVNGELERYYETVWEPLKPHERDAATLIALNPTGLDAETVDALLDFPWTQQELWMDEMPLSHIIDRVGEQRIQVFHDSFRSFIINQLGTEEISQSHERLFDYLFKRCTQAPTKLDSLTYHAENGPGRAALKELVTLDRVLGWWSKGVYVDRVLEAVELSFDAALQAGDYETAFDCTIIGGVTRDMLDVYANDTDRLAFFTARGDRDAALRLVNQIREYDGGTAESLSSMQTVARTWEDEAKRDWLRGWAKDFQEVEQPSWDPDAYFELAAILLHPDEFWEAADQMVREDTGEHFVRAVLGTTRKHPDLLDFQNDPPDWLLENSTVALEACQDIVHSLPDPWRDKIQKEVSSPSDVSVAGLHTLLLCGGPQDMIIQRIEEYSLGEPEQSPTEDGPRFSDAYYVGAIFASCGRSPDEVLAQIETNSNKRPQVHQFLALIGAATSRESDVETELWVDAAFDFLKDRYIDQSLADSSIPPGERWGFTKSVEKAVTAFSDVVEQGSSSRLQRTYELAKKVHEDVDSLLRTVTKGLLGTHPDEMLPESIEERFEATLQQPPESEPPTRDLIDLAYHAAEEGYPEHADRYFETGIERCFRYGYRKDVFLNDVWKGFVDMVDGDWDRHMGTAIQLVNWARLLHELTDGKETAHYEGIFLRTLLDEGLINVESALESASDQTTINKLRDWRLEHPSVISEHGLRAIIDAERAKLRESEFTSKSIDIFARTAEIADDNGWDDLVVKSLIAMDRGDYVDEGVSDDMSRKVRTLASSHGVDIPNKLQSEDKDDNSVPSPEVDEEDFPTEHEELHRLLSSYLEGDPVTEADFVDLNTEKLRVAGELLCSRDYRYDPRSAAPVARILSKRGHSNEGIELLIKVIGQRDLISWYVGGPGFEPLAGVLLDLAGDDALEAVLEAWRKSSIVSGTYYQTVFPHLMWIVKRTEGQAEAEELMSHTMKQLRRLFWPYEDRIQVWGKLAEGNHGRSSH